MTLTPQTFLIVCPMLFLAGLVDAIGGGGGLISLPAYLLAGLPAHQAIATNKLSSTCGTALATVRFIRMGLVNWRLALPTLVCGILGSSIGANASMAVDEKLMERILFFVLPVTAFIVLNPRIFRDNDAKDILLNSRTWITALLSSLVIGLYDGFYGPGTGTFLIIAFTGERYDIGPECHVRIRHIDSDTCSLKRRPSRKINGGIVSHNRQVSRIASGSNARRYGLDHAHNTSVSQLIYVFHIRSFKRSPAAQLRYIVITCTVRN